MASSVGHWNDESGDDSWDTLFLGGDFMPGVARVDVTLSSDLDIAKPKAGKGATIKDNGDPPAKLKIRLQIVTKDEIDALAQKLSLLRPKAKNGARDPVEIGHPNANFWGINTITITDISSPQPDAVDGWIITIDAVQWFPAPKAVAAASKKPTATGDAAAWAPYVDKKAATDKPSATGAPAANAGIPVVELSALPYA